MLAGALLVGGMSAAAAQADHYGEIQHFGEKGTGLGQLTEPELALGVDQTENSVFVVDAGKNNGFRLQKFVEKGGKYEAVASVSFKPKGQSQEEPDEVQGVAIDTKLKRAYILAVQTRGNDGGVDSEDPAAGVLYAFNTEPSGNVIEPAAGTKSEGVLAEQTVLKTVSKVPGEALLEPSGIAVDPVNDDIIIAAHVDRGKKPFEEEETAALQQVTSTGTLGARYVDEGNFFEECGCVGSPAVSSTGHVYVIAERDEIVEIPAGFKSSEEPKRKIALACEVGCPLERLTEWPDTPFNGGGQLSIGEEGRIYASGKITLQSGGDQQYGGAIVFNEGFAEEGWTGGQSPASAAEKCIVNDLLEEPAIAAGKEEKVFMLERNPAGSRIVEFGPNGSGCPPGTATVPTAKAGGVEVEPIAMNETVTLSSTLTQANALSVEWEFGDGTKQTVSTREQETTEVQHVFTKTGTLTVKETIHTDNLATPVLTVERKVRIVGPPTVVTEEAKVTGQSSATVTGTVNPNGQEVTACEVEYGTTIPYTKKTKCVALPPGKGEEPKPVEAQLSGLEKGTLYHFRFVATNNKGLGEGNDKTFTTAAEPVPSAETTSASVEGETAATLRANVNPEGAELTKCQFEYGPTEKYGSVVACSTLPPKGTSSVAVSAPAKGLSAGTTYHFRIVVTDLAGESVRGKDLTFKTKAKEEAPAPPPPPPPAPPGENPITGNGGVLPHQEIKPPPAVPDATIAGNSATVSGSGAFTLKVSCPAGESTCSGTITLRTLKAVVASVAHGAKSKASILTLATGSFTVAGGQTKTLTLHLSAKARALLAHSHSVVARVTVVAHDPAGATHTTTVNVTLRAAKPKHH